MSAKATKNDSTLSYMAKSAATASFAGSIAEAMTIPMDTVKVRLQMQSTTGLAEGKTPKYNGLIGGTRTIVAEEGARALFNGLTAGIHRQILFSGIRVSLYEPVKNIYAGPLKEGEKPLLYQKILAAMTTGAIGITVANPTDVVKVRLQN